MPNLRHMADRVDPRDLRSRSPFERIVERPTQEEIDEQDRCYPDRAYHDPFNTEDNYF